MRDVYRSRWLTLFPIERHTAASDAYGRLWGHYAEPHRFYHSFKHIAACLEHLDRVKSHLEDPLSVELALWFHDIIYNTRQADNEEQSARLAVEELSALELPPAIIQNVRHLTVLTKHPSIPKTPDEIYLLDIDLSILGAPEQLFDRYEAQIRQEYGWVPESVYRQRRLEVLKGFLRQDSIYHSELFLREREETARTNIQRSIARLSDQLS